MPNREMTTGKLIRGDYYRREKNQTNHQKQSVSVSSVHVFLKGGNIFTAGGLKQLFLYSRYVSVEFPWWHGGRTEY